MKCIIGNQVVLSRPPEGPLAAQIGSFAKSVSEQGYSLASIHRQVFLAACFSRWLKQKGVRLRSICSDHLVLYLRYRARHRRPCEEMLRPSDISSTFCAGRAWSPAKRDQHANRLRLSVVPRHSGSTCWRSVRWRIRRLSTTFRSSAVSSKAVLVPDESRSRVSVQAML